LLPEDEPINNPLDIIYTRFQKKMESDITTETIDKNNTIHSFLKYSNTIMTYLPFNVLLKEENIKFTQNIDYNNILKNDFSGNFVLNYIIDEILRLLTYNTNKNLKTNIVTFILEILTYTFNSTNYEILYFNKNLNHFNQILYTSEFYLEIESADLMIDAIDYYGNQHNLEEMNDEERERFMDEIDDINEETDAIDIDESADAESLFDLRSVEY
jgi:hypothetical protein